jgi:hypothetical protein
MPTRLGGTVCASVSNARRITVRPAQQYVIGVMDLRAMAVVTAAITAERLTPAGQQVARGIGGSCHW